MWTYRGSTHSLGTKLQELTAIGHRIPRPTPMTRTLMSYSYSPYKLGLQAFSLRVGKIRAARMSDNTSTVAFLTNRGGGGGQIVAVERFSHRHICRPRGGG